MEVVKVIPGLNDRWPYVKEDYKDDPEGNLEHLEETWRVMHPIRFSVREDSGFINTGARKDFNRGDFVCVIFSLDLYSKSKRETIVQFNSMVT